MAEPTSQPATPNAIESARIASYLHVHTAYRRVDHSGIEEREGRIVAGSEFSGKAIGNDSQPRLSIQLESVHNADQLHALLAREFCQFGSMAPNNLTKLAPANRAIQGFGGS